MHQGKISDDDWIERWTNARTGDEVCLNGYKNKTPIHAGYKGTTSNQGTHTE